MRAKTHCECVLEASGDARSPVAPVSKLEEYPLAPILSLPADDQRRTGLPLVKALLLAGFARAQPEIGPALTVAIGAAKARHIERWKAELPPPLPLQATLPEAIAHCQPCLGAPGSPGESKQAHPRVARGA